MSAYWKIDTHGDPIGVVQGFTQSVWSQVGLRAVLAPPDGNGKPRLLKDPPEMSEVNPFRPLMRENLARFIPENLKKHPEEKLGVLLRPCEMRALVEMSKRQALPRDQLVTLCFDCLGTYPLDEYEWRARKAEALDSPPNDTLRFARQGGILAYRYRAACQVCASPGAKSADFNVHVIGLPVRQQILIEVQNGSFHDQFDLTQLTDGPADAAIVEQHLTMLSRQEERHTQTMERVMHTLDELLPKDIEELISQLESCGDCMRCMSVCPICSVEFPRKDSAGRIPIQAIRRWLVSCAGCGMCEQVCTSNLPLGVIFGSIRKRLDEELVYTPGRDWADPLPV
jgi:formate dehydrogenase subunit beta